MRLSVNEQDTQLMPNLYPGELPLRPLPFGSIDAMWLTLGALANNETSDINGAICFPLLLRRWRGVLSLGRAHRMPSPDTAGPRRLLLRRRALNETWSS